VGTLVWVGQPVEGSARLHLPGGKSLSRSRGESVQPGKAGSRQAVDQEIRNRDVFSGGGPVVHWPLPAAQEQEIEDGTKRGGSPAAMPGGPHPGRGKVRLARKLGRGSVRRGDPGGGTGAADVRAA